ncbi:MAG: methyltransferase domain-containing protein, partial [Anderseniella sp.]|nr:methyltransferase domain-containing protein [Anderseniella sp.]
MAPDTAPQARQSWSADSYSTHARFVADLAGAVVEWLEPRKGERILDLGCGDGALTVKLVEAGAVVKGVDKSDDLLAAARKLGLDVEEADGQALGFDEEFDAVFSNAALHWMNAADQVIDGV